MQVDRAKKRQFRSNERKHIPLVEIMIQLMVALREEGRLLSQIKSLLVKGEQGGVGARVIRT